MNFFKRGITSLKRRPGKTAILLLIIFILGNVIAGAVSVNQAVSNTEINLRKKIGALATIEIDWESFNNKGEMIDYNVAAVPVDIIKKVGELKYIKYYDYTTTTGLESSEIKSYTDPNNGYPVKDYARSMMPVEESQNYPSYFTIMGNEYPEIMDVKENKIKITKGRIFTQDEMKNTKDNYAVLISENLAKTNNLTVGSSFKLGSQIYKNDGMGYGKLEGAMAESKVVTTDISILPITPTAAAKVEFEFTVVGLFEPVKTTNNNAQGGVDYQAIEKENRIYTTNNAVANITETITKKYKEVNPNDEAYVAYNNIVPIYVLEDPADLAKFKEEASAMLPEHYKMTDNGGALEQISGPMKNMQWIASLVLYVAIGATLIIITLIITLFLRDRKHEIGIYLALGEKRNKIVLQILLEVCIVAIIGITLSLITGNILAGMMSENMLNNEIIEQQSNNNGGMVIYGGAYTWTQLDGIGYGSNLTNDDLMQNYQVSLNLQTILMFYLIGIGTILVSTIVPIIYITRLNPKKVLM